MPKYKASIVEINRTTYYYEVEAENTEDALDLITSGEVDPVSQYTKYIDGDEYIDEV